MHGWPWYFGMWLYPETWAAVGALIVLVVVLCVRKRKGSD